MVEWWCLWSMVIVMVMTLSRDECRCNSMLSRLAENILCGLKKIKKKKNIFCLLQSDTAFTCCLSNVHKNLFKAKFSQVFIHLLLLLLLQLECEITRQKCDTPPHKDHFASYKDECLVQWQQHKQTQRLVNSSPAPPPSLLMCDTENQSDAGFSIWSSFIAPALTCGQGQVFQESHTSFCLLH